MEENKSKMSAVKSALMAVGGLALAWATVEIACKPYLSKGRDELKKSLDPNYDPDDDSVPEQEKVQSDDEVADPKS